MKTRKTLLFWKVIIISCYCQVLLELGCRGQDSEGRVKSKKCKSPRTTAHRPNYLSLFSFFGQHFKVVLESLCAVARCKHVID